MKTILAFSGLNIRIISLRESDICLADCKYIVTKWTYTLLTYSFNTHQQVKRRSEYINFSIIVILNGRENQQIKWYYIWLWPWPEDWVLWRSLGEAYLWPTVDDHGLMMMMIMKSIIIVPNRWETVVKEELLYRVKFSVIFPISNFIPIGTNSKIYEKTGILKILAVFLFLCSCFSRWHSCYFSLSYSDQRDHNNNVGHPSTSTLTLWSTDGWYLTWKILTLLGIVCVYV